KVLDFYHACEHINEALDLCDNLTPKEQKKKYNSLKEKLKNNKNGVNEVVEELRTMASKDNLDEMENDLKYFLDHIDHMQYELFIKNKISIGSGAVESAVRRVINLRFKGNGSLWKKKIVEGLMHLRSFFKSGRWKELILRVIKGEFIMPTFEPQNQGC
ncbi:hypothetical protein MHK_002297, partial [Candidatus Magnetomorum sp. HK-1]